MGCVFDKAYIFLSDSDTVSHEQLEKTLRDLLPYANVNTNLYLVTGRPLVKEKAKSEVEGLEKILHRIQQFLQHHLFMRIYVHIVHPVSLGTMEKTKLCYDRFKEITRHFDREGYRHQEVPRLMVLPLLVADGKTDWAALDLFCGVLRDAFLLPSVCVCGDPKDIDRAQLDMMNVEKCYWATGDAGDVFRIGFCLARQDIVDDGSARLAAEMPVTDPCPASLYMAMEDGRVFPCLDAYQNQQSLATLDNDLDIADMMAHHGDYWTSHPVCPECRERLAQSFSNFPLPQETRNEIGAFLYHLGTYHEGQGKMEAAVSAYKASLPLSPPREKDTIRFKLGLARTMTGAYKEALDIFEETGKAYEQAHFFHFYKSICLFQLGDFQSALQGFQRAELLEPPQDDLTQILIYAGTCFNYLGQHREALRPLLKAKELDRSVKEIWSTLGFSYFHLKEFDRAIVHLEKAIELDPFSAVDYASLGANYREKGDIVSAITMFEKALALDPSMSAARENLERLKSSS